jgi:hypothetical protein
VDRLKDETDLYSTIVKGQLYFEKHDLTDNISRVIMRRLEHLYYKVIMIYNYYYFRMLIIIDLLVDYINYNIIHIIIILFVKFLSSSELA